MSQSESDHSPANLASIQCRERTADFLVLIDAECERLAAENTQAQAEIEASSRFKNSLMVDGVIRRASRIPLSPPNHPSIKAQAMNISEFDDAKETTDDLIQGPLPAGTVAPDFTLHATPDQQLSLHELRGNPVILAFYPADWSSVCGDQLTLYNQLLPTFKEYGATLLGISVDSAWCHQAFAKDRNFHFSLLADFEPKGAVARQYGAYESQLGVCKRALFVIDKEGVVAWSYVSPMAINPGADGILDALDALANSPQSTPTKN